VGQKNLHARSQKGHVLCKDGYPSRPILESNPRNRTSGITYEELIPNLNATLTNRNGTICDLNRTLNACCTGRIGWITAWIAGPKGDEYVTIKLKIFGKFYGVNLYGVSILCGIIITDKLPSSSSFFQVAESPWRYLEFSLGKIDLLTNNATGNGVISETNRLRDRVFRCLTFGELGREEK